jgi:hypothetical protein
MMGVFRIFSDNGVMPPEFVFDKSITQNARNTDYSHIKRIKHTYGIHLSSKWTQCSAPVAFQVLHGKVTQAPLSGYYRV